MGNSALLGLAAGSLVCLGFASCEQASIEGQIRFEEVTAAAGIDYAGGSYGAAWGDFDGDGFADIWAGGHGPRMLYRNRGDGTFENIGPDVIAARGGDLHAAAWADVDGDGDQDLIQLAGAELGRP